jgi:hypothetical protein
MSVHSPAPSHGDAAATPNRLRGRVTYPLRAARAVLSDPFEGYERVRDRFAERRENRAALPPYEPTEDWDRALHQMIGAPWPCAAVPAFELLWSDVMAALTRKGLPIGRGAFGGWDDGDPALARAAWCLTVHLRPKTVVETGVARGVTTRVILEALERNGSGHLWSIDLPPLIEKALEDQTGAALVPSRCARWTYLKGSSRRRLVPLLAELSELDLFLHDSMHTARNLRFELGHAWDLLRTGGVLLADDIHRNDGFRAFSRSVAAHRSLVGRADDGQALVGLIRKEAPSWRSQVRSASDMTTITS